MLLNTKFCLLMLVIGLAGIGSGQFLSSISVLSAATVGLTAACPPRFMPLRPGQNDMGETYGTYGKYEYEQPQSEYPQNIRQYGRMGYGQ